MNKVICKEDRTMYVENSINSSLKRIVLDIVLLEIIKYICASLYLLVYVCLHIFLVNFKKILIVCRLI